MKAATLAAAFIGLGFPMLLFGHGGERIDNADQAVPYDEPLKLFLAHPLRPLRAQGKNEIAHVRGAVVDPDLHVVGNLVAELPHDSARIIDRAGAVIQALIPVRRPAQDRPRIA